MKTSTAQSVTTVTAGPRRGIRRCTLATTGRSQRDPGMRSAPGGSARGPHGEERQDDRRG